MSGALRRAFPPTIRQLLSPEYTIHPTKIEVNGWVKSVRRQKNVGFAVISDGSSTRGLQAVFSKNVIPDGLTNGCSVRLFGKLVDSQGPCQAKELQVDTAEVVGQCNPDLYPIQKQNLSVDYLRDNCHLRARVDKLCSMLRVRDGLMHGMHSYFEGQGFLHVHTPIVTSSDCEGAGEAFSVGTEVDTHVDDPSTETMELFFAKKAYLTVSSQLHLEALATARSRVYTVSPCFRAERSQTSRHLSEFWMLEAEWMFTRAIGDVTAVVEDMVKYCVRKTVEIESGQSPELAKNVDALALDRPWISMTYSDAIRELQTGHTHFKFKPVWGKALQSEHEKWLANMLRTPVFVTDYPNDLKPFYMRVNDDGQTVACFDLLVSGLGELAGGSLREERLELLDIAMARVGLLGKEEYDWYRELRKFGGAPHGGFGLGFERLVSVVSGQPNVRECIAMPRWVGRMLL